MAADGMVVRAREAGRWRADAVGTAAIFSMVVVLALWLHAGGLHELLAGGAATATSLGRVSGLVAADLLLIQVVLMARVPLVERSYGQDALARWHRYVGFTSFWLIMAHIVFIIPGYAGGGDPGGVLREAWSLTVDYPGMLLAVAGTAALVGVVVLSVRAARRRMRYESWHLLHLYAYLGVGLALPHQLWTGTDFVGSAAARAYWWGAWAFAAGCLLVYRLGLPAWRSARHRLRVREVRWEAPGVFSVYLTGRDLHRLPARAGQFLNWRFLTGTGWTRAHPYSLSAPPHPRGLRVTVRANGDDARRIAATRPGTRVLIEGPYGRLTGTVRTRRRLLFLAAGIGITPLRALLEELPYQPGEAALVYRANRPEDFALRAELDAIARWRGALVHYLDGPPPSRPSWLPARLARAGPAGTSDTWVLRRLVPDVAERDVYLCGPAPWMAAVRSALRAAGVPDRQVHAEDFAW